MSLARLFLSGLLVAGGLILGAFTLHGYFDPQWAQKQAQATGVRAPSPPKTVNAFQNRNRFVTSRAEQTAPAAKAPAPSSGTASNAIVKTADVKSAKTPVKKKVAEKTAKKTPQQASVWPWNLFGSN